MKTKKEKGKKQIKYSQKTIITFLIILLIILLFCSGYSLGKEISSVELKATGEVANPILVVNNNEPIKITNLNNEGYYDFKIRNYNENGDITDVDLKYYIEILTDTDEELSFKIYKDGQNVMVEDNKTQELYFSKGIMQEENFRIEIKYNKDKNNSMQDIKKDIQIKVHSEQVKT